jgi:hypothetical protein
MNPQERSGLSSGHYEDGRIRQSESTINTEHAAYRPLSSMRSSASTKEEEDAQYNTT